MCNNFIPKMIGMKTKTRNNRKKMLSQYITVECVCCVHNVYFIQWFVRNLRRMQHIFIVFNGVWHLSNSWKYIPFLSFVQIYPKYATYYKHKIMKRLDIEKKLKLLVLLNAKSRLLVFRCSWVLATLKVTLYIGT